MSTQLRDATQLTPQEEALFEQYLQDAGIAGDPARIGPRPDPSAYPLSMAQERLWFLEQLAPGTATQHIPDAWILRGPLVLAHFAASLAEVDRRHEVMRLRVDSLTGEPHASLLPSATSAEELPIEYVDLCDLPEAAREAAIIEHGRDLLTRPFGSTDMRLWRAALLRTEEQVHIWFMVMHHMISDGASLQILVRELAASYEVFCAGRQPALPALSVQYADYAAWEARARTPALLGDALTYWEAQLAGPLPLLKWPTGRPRSQRQRLRGATLRTPILPKARLPELQAASSRLSVSPFSFLLAVYAALLLQSCGAEDVLIGTPASNREDPELESLIGLFVDTLILRLRPGLCTTFADAAIQAHKCLLSAQKHRVPLDQVVKVLNLHRDLSRPVLRQTAFAMQPGRLADVMAGPLLIQPWQGHIEADVARLDLALFVSEEQEGLSVIWEYNTDILDAAFVSSLSAAYGRMVLALLAHPRLTLSELATAGSWLPPIQDVSLLTEAQKLFWFSEQLSSGATMYFDRVRAALHMDGSVAPTLLAASLAQVICASDALRSTIEIHDGAPVRRVRAELPVDLALVDLSGSTDSAAAAAEWMDQMAETPMRVQDRMLRAALLQLTDGRDVFYVEIHHMVADLSSLRRLLFDVSVACQGQAPALPRLVRPFADFVGEESRYRQSLEYQRDERYWQEKIAREVTAARFYKAGNAKAETATSRLSVSLGVRRAAALKQLMRRHSIFSPAIAIKSALFAYLRRTTGESVLRIGEPLAYRPEGFEDTIGLFVNICVLDVTLTEDETFASLLAKVQAETLTVLRHQRYPLRHPPDRRLYDVYFNYQNASFVEFAGKPATFELLHNGHSYDLLTVQLQEFAGLDLLALDIDFRADAFNSAQRQTSMGHFMRLLDAMLTDAAQPIDAVEILSESEQKTLLHDYNNTARGYDLSMCLHELIDRQCARTPDAIALRFEGDSLTYRELQQRAEALAQLLAALGVEPDRVVGVFMERSMELVVALLAVLKAGGAYLPLDPTYPSERLAYMMNDAALAAVITQTHLRARLPDYPGPVLCADGLPPPDDRPIAPRPHGPDQLAYVIYTSGSTGQPKGVAVPHRGICNRLLWMQEAYGLGAKDVVLQKTPYSFDVSVWEFFWPLLVGCTLVIARPGGHMDPDYLCQIIIREGVTALHFVPSMLEVFLRHSLAGKLSSVRYVFCSGEALGYDLQQRFFAQMTAELHNLYGPTEASVDVTAWKCDPKIHRGIVPIGFPIANTRVYILDSAGRLLPPGLIGEVYLAGTGLARGYLNKPDLTTARFVERELAPGRCERLYRTLDLGRYLDDGSIEFLGRADNQIKLRGFRIELGEIESVLSQHPDVREVVVVVHEARAGDRRLVAFIVPTRSDEDLIGTLRAHAQRYLPEYMVPAAFVAIERMPLSINGKVDRRSLPAPNWQQNAREGNGSATPATPLQRLLSELFAEVLGLPTVGRTDDFFRLGGHSLLATRVIARLGQILPMAVPLSLMFEATTVDALADRLEQLWQKQNEKIDLSEVLTGVLSMPNAEVEARLERLDDAGTSVSENALAGVAALDPRRRELLQKMLRQGSGAPRRRRALLPNYPLSFAQQRLWLVDQIEPQSPRYNVPECIRLRGSLDRTALAQALHHVVLRHEALRTSFFLEGGQPRQVVQQSLTLPIEEHDVSAIPQQDREETALKWGGELARQPFDLTATPLLRAHLISLGPDDHLFLLNVHHIVYDGWSRDVLVAELAAAYSHALAGTPLELPPLELQYPDYALWESEHGSAARHAEHVDFFRSELSGVPALLSLPLDFPEPTAPSHAGGQYITVLNEDVRMEFLRLCSHAQVTPFVAMTAAWSALLNLWTGQSHIVLGVPFANRLHPQLEPLIGFFVNMLPLRMRLHEDPSFEVFLQQARQATMLATAHQQVPFERLVEALNPPRALGRNPIFQVSLAVTTQPAQPITLPGLTAEPVNLDTGVTAFDLSLFVRLEPQRLVMSFVYSAERFLPQTMVRLASQLATLIRLAAQEPRRRISDLGMAADFPRATPAPQGKALWGRAMGERPGSLPSALVAVPEEGEQAAPSPALEESLVRLFAGVLGVAGVGVDADFFALGGHSLLGVELLHRIRQETGCQLRLASLMLAPTVRKLGRLIATRAQDSRGDALVPLRPGDGTPALYLLHPAGGQLLGFRSLIAQLPPCGAIWGLQSFSAAGAGPEPADIPSMCSAYADIILRSQKSVADGPILLGWSMGGAVAVGLAGELRSRGVPICGVLLFDSYLFPAEDEVEIDPVTLLYQMVGVEASARFRALPTARTQEFRARLAALATTSDRRMHTLQWAKEHHLLPAGMPADQFEKEMEATELHHQMLRGYIPPQVSVPLFAFWAGQRLDSASPRARTDWGRLTSGTYQEAEAEGNHYTMMHMPHARKLALAAAAVLRSWGAIPTMTLKG